MRFQALANALAETGVEIRFELRDDEPPHSFEQGIFLPAKWENAIISREYEDELFTCLFHEVQHIKNNGWKPSPSVGSVRQSTFLQTKYKNSYNRAPAKTRAKFPAEFFELACRALLDSRDDGLGFESHQGSPRVYSRYFDTVVDKMIEKKYEDMTDGEKIHTAVCMTALEYKRQINFEFDKAGIVDRLTAAYPKLKKVVRDRRVMSIIREFAELDSKTIDGIQHKHSAYGASGTDALGVYGLKLANALYKPLKELIAPPPPPVEPEKQPSEAAENPNPEPNNGDDTSDENQERNESEREADGENTDQTNESDDETAENDADADGEVDADTGDSDTNSEPNAGNQDAETDAEPENDETGESEPNDEGSPAESDSENTDVDDSETESGSDEQETEPSDSNDAELDNHQTETDDKGNEDSDTSELDENAAENASESDSGDETETEDKDSESAGESNSGSTGDSDGGSGAESGCDSAGETGQDAGEAETGNAEQDGDGGDSDGKRGEPEIDWRDIRDNKVSDPGFNVGLANLSRLAKEAFTYEDDESLVDVLRRIFALEPRAEQLVRLNTQHLTAYKYDPDYLFENENETKAQQDWAVALVVDLSSSMTYRGGFDKDSFEHISRIECVKKACLQIHTAIREVNELTQSSHELLVVGYEGLEIRKDLGYLYSKNTSDGVVRSYRQTKNDKPVNDILSEYIIKRADDTGDVWASLMKARGGTAPATGIETLKLLLEQNPVDDKRLLVLLLTDGLFEAQDVADIEWSRQALPDDHVYILIEMMQEKATRGDYCCATMEKFPDVLEDAFAQAMLES